MHPDRRSCLCLAVNDTVGWQAKCFSCWVRNWSLPLRSFFLCTKSLYNPRHLEKFLARFDGILYTENSRRATSEAHPVVNSQSCHPRVLNWVNTVKYLPSRAGPILEKSVSGYHYWLYILQYWPSRGLWHHSSKDSLGNTLGLEGYITPLFLSIPLHIALGTQLIPKNKSKWQKT